MKTSVLVLPLLVGVTMFSGSDGFFTGIGSFSNILGGKGSKTGSIFDSILGGATNPPPLPRTMPRPVPTPAPLPPAPVMRPTRGGGPTRGSGGGFNRRRPQRPQGRMSRGGNKGHGGGRYGNNYNSHGNQKYRPVANKPSYPTYHNPGHNSYNDCYNCK